MQAVVKMSLQEVEDLKRNKEVVTPETKLEQLTRDFEYYKEQNSSKKFYDAQNEINSLKLEKRDLTRKVEDLKESLAYQINDSKEQTLWNREELKTQHSYEISRLKEEHKKDLKDKKQTIDSLNYQIKDKEDTIVSLRNKIELSKWSMRGFWSRLLNKTPQDSFAWMY